MNIGIDKISFFIPPRYVDLKDLAQRRQVDPNKFLIGLGQEKMAFNLNTEDIITYGANAAAKILTEDDKKKITMVIVGTESSVDESKASAVVIHHLLGIQDFARSIEIKQACYGGTAALKLACDYLQTRPNEKVLVIAADIARYGLNTPGEVTQGAGAVAMLISKNPHILTIENQSVTYTENVYDFWRPTGEKYPRVEGKLSNETYINGFHKLVAEFKRRYNLELTDFKGLCFHTPYTKMGKKALLPEIVELSEEKQQEFLLNYELSITYSKQVGNLYTGSLYLSLISLLENHPTLKAGDSIGLYSYGSGCVSEFFVGFLSENFKEYLLKEYHQELLNNREKLAVDAYERLFEEQTLQESPLSYSLKMIENGIRYYK